LFQCAALIPGTSRSGATIVGALLCGLSRKAAAEFSFFLAMPTIAGATVFSLWKARDTLDFAGQGTLYLVASVAAFLSALVCVRWLLRYVSSHDFTGFAWYRIACGVAILLVAFVS
jgi:undecaprenyl-diphosphatase